MDLVLRAKLREFSESTYGECWIWQGGTVPRGYGVLHVKEDGKWTTRYAHRLAYAEYVEPIPEGMFVCHSCDTPACCNPDHLWLGTHADNMRDCRRKGRTSRGEFRPSAKLDDALVKKMRDMRSQGTTLRALGDVFGVSIECARRVVSRESWAHIP